MLCYIYLLLLLIVPLNCEIEQTVLSAATSKNTYTRYTEFISKLTKLQPDGCRTVHSSGGAAGGVISEGQGYGLFISAITAVAVGPSSSNFAGVTQTAYEIFKGWKRMCKQSAATGSCQSPFYCTEGSGSYPCSPHWKFTDSLANDQTGSAPDGDEDAILGMVLLTTVTSTSTSKPSWWSEVALWCYQSIIQFYASSVTEEVANEAVLKLGACWGGMDCNNPSYHAPGAWRAFISFLKNYGPGLGKSSTEIDAYVAKYNKLISSSYKILLADQNTGGLTTNWYVPQRDLTKQGSTSCSGSGTPSAEFGAEAARGVWRVALDWIWYSSPESATYLEKVVRQLVSKHTGSSFSSLDTGGLVTSIFNDWYSPDNAFIYGPTLTALVKPVSGLSGQAAALSTAANKVSSAPEVNGYYAGSWTVISTLTINGDLAKATSLVSGKTTAPVATTPTAAPTAAPTVAPTVAPTKAPTTAPTAAPTKAPTTAPSSPPKDPRCGVSGAVIKPDWVEFVGPAGVTVTKASVRCSNGVVTACTGGSPKWQCAVTNCASPVPMINDKIDCPLILGTVSQSCPKGSVNNFWVEFFPPANAKPELVTVKCADGRYLPCPVSQYDSKKVQCTLYGAECVSPLPLYDGSPCPFPAAILEEQSTTSMNNELGTEGIMGISVGCLIIVALVVAIVVITRRRQTAEEIV